VLKRTRSDGGSQSKELGLAREFKFYEHTADSSATGPLSQLASCLPRIIYAGGSMDTGLKDILMQDLSGAVQVMRMMSGVRSRNAAPLMHLHFHAAFFQSGYFFGPYSPLNWGKDLRALMRGWDADCGLDVQSVTQLAFAAAASAHAPFWNKFDDLKHLPWLRGVGWRDGEEEALWTGFQRQAADAWDAERAKPCGTIVWDTQLVACLEASLARARPEAGGWGLFQTELKTRPLTLVHGDFHPANMMISRDGASCRLFLLDWEVVGVGSGPQELGQYLISHASPQAREEIWRAAVEAYYARLVALNPSVADSMSLDDCIAEYINGGAGRWFWFLPILASMCPPKMTQYFHDQVLAFVRYHNVVPETCPMPRV
jgi:hypothetical protein